MELNQVNLIGNLTRDPETRNTQNGSVVTNFSIAVNTRRGQEQDVFYIDVAVWGKTAENCAQYLVKGSQVRVSGRLHEERWTDQQTGQNRSKLAITANEVSFGASPQGRNGQQNQNGGYQGQQNQPNTGWGNDQQQNGSYGQGNGQNGGSYQQGGYSQGGYNNQPAGNGGQYR